MIGNQKIRKSGKTPAEEAAHEEISEQNQQLVEADGPEERYKLFDNVGFSRFRVDWKPEQREIISEVKEQVEDRLFREFADLYAVLHRIWDIVREPTVDKDGEPIKNLGFTVWKVDDFGSYIEDWSKITFRQREHFLYQIIMGQSMWDQLAQDAWMEAMMARRFWETSFASGYESLPATRSPKPTVEDRQQRAKLFSADDHNFALVMTYYSRRADSLVRSMNAISQRLKDIHTT